MVGENIKTWVHVGCMGRTRGGKTGATNLMLDPLHALRDGHQICRHTKYRLPSRLYGIPIASTGIAK